VSEWVSEWVTCRVSVCVSVYVCATVGFIQLNLFLVSWVYYALLLCHFYLNICFLDIVVIKYSVLISPPAIISGCDMCRVRTLFDYWCPLVASCVHMLTALPVESLSLFLWQQHCWITPLVVCIGLYSIMIVDCISNSEMMIR
jgi:hypothetical protein